MGRRWRQKRRGGRGGGGGGRGGGGRGGRGRGFGRPKRSRDDGNHVVKGDDYVMTVVAEGNYKFEAYYAAQGIHNSRWASKEGGGEEEEDAAELVACSSNEERLEERLRWRKSVGEVLPTSFRINSDIPKKLRDHVESELHQKLKAMEEENGKERLRQQQQQQEEQEAKAEEETKEGDGKEGEEADEQRKKRPAFQRETVVRKVGFLPSGAYQLSLDRTTLRKRPELSILHDWMKRETKSGFISRQEIVSMIPPVVLNPDPADRVLDMCAAPGSKTSQLLEAVGRDGVVVANDSSGPRAHMLVTQLRRIMHSCPSCIVTQCDAQLFPSAVTQFDKILADVPCTGDATSRKNINVWKTWNQMQSYALHPLQIDIAWKGVAQLLKVGGHLCYSTCSFNPSENEAVVAELLRRAKGNLESVDVKLPGFRTRPGMSSWKVFIEDKTRKQMKDERRKHNPEMERRRKEWEEKRKREGQGEDGNKSEDVQEAAEEDGGDAQVESKEVGAANGTADSSNRDDTNEQKDDDDEDSNEVGKVDEVAADKKMVSQRFEPTSMDEADLIKMVTESAGLAHYESFEDVTDVHHKKRLKRSAFPPTEDEAKAFHLERCIRCLPHDNDTGGFFIALLRKTGPIGAIDRKQAASNAGGSSEEVVAETAANGGDDDGEEDDSTVEPDVKRAKVDETAQPEEETEAGVADGDNDVEGKNGDEMNEEGTAEDGGDDDVMDADVIDDGDDDHDKKRPIMRGEVKGNYLRDADGKAHKELGRDDFIEVKDEIIAPLIEFYGLSDSPTFRKDLYMTRACGDCKVIYYIAKPVKDLIDLGIQKKVTVVNSGLKGFVRNNKDCAVRYRIAQEGAHFLASHMTKRKYTVNKDDFMKCLAGTGSIPFSELSEGFQEALRPLETGAFVAVLEGFEEEYEQKMLLTMWKCRGEKIDGLVAKVELEAIRTKLNALEECEAGADA